MWTNCACASAARTGELRSVHLAVSALLAFLGSGRLSLSSLVMAARHMPDASSTTTTDRCCETYDRAGRLLLQPPAGAGVNGGLRISFHMAEGTDSHELGEYNMVFLVVPVGVAVGEKAGIVAHIGEYMTTWRPALLVVQSAHGTRGFLCVILEPADVARRVVGASTPCRRWRRSR